MPPRLPALAILTLSLLLSIPASSAAPAMETGEISGAKFAIARPETTWNRRVLLLAHGLRSEDRPLVADLFPDHLAYRTLLEEGWIVAKTSYRRNGLIVADAIADLDALRAHIAAKFGEPTRVVVEGESMGGLIATFIAERALVRPPLYHGAVAIGAALQVREPGSSLELTHRPHLPLVFLTNQSEITGPQRYVTAEVTDPTALRAVLFRVARDGHVNVNQAERLVALRALDAWIERGSSALPAPPPGAEFFDATVAPQPQPSQVTLHADGRGFDARVIEVSAIYGNAFLNAQPADFAAAGIPRGTHFLITCHAQTFRVLHGRDFGSVKRGEWVAFPNADGFTWLARNYADAAATAKIRAGDTVTVRRLDEEKPLPLKKPPTR
ncbi:MAG: SAM-dependent chlorinase/fluorinase [Opitutaceae bacterium]|nr:SAM-dependent chlorinase/fluorinase [Opitutaceae bacterium]